MKVCTRISIPYLSQLIHELYQKGRQFSLPRQIIQCHKHLHRFKRDWPLELKRLRGRRNEEQPHLIADILRLEHSFTLLVTKEKKEDSNAPNKELVHWENGVASHHTLVTECQKLVGLLKAASLAI